MSEVEHRERFGYQPALDGLRALAVLGVVFYHYTLGSDAGGWASGGFLGVDVFFVLSGFLITSLLVVEWRREGRVSLRRFWARRARRLLPALMVTLLLVAAYAAFVTDTIQKQRIRTDTIGTLLYVQNWHTISAGTLEQSALGHTWSLSIEGQWYLLFPLVFIGLMTWFGARHRRLVPVLVAAAISSALLTAALYVPGRNGRVYFGTDTRAQELLVGSVLALLLVGRAGPSRRGTRNALGVAGALALALLVVALPVVNIRHAFLYRGGFLAVCVLTALVILVVMLVEDSFVARVLSLRVLVLIGLISYGIYLLHVPVKSILNPERTGLSDWPLMILRVAVTLVLAMISYLLVEQRVRRGAQVPRWVVVGAPATVGVLVLLLVIGTTGGTARSELSGEPYLLRQARQETPAGVTRVLVVGDESAALLGVASGGPHDGDGMRAAVVGATRCDLVPHSALRGGSPVEAPAGCDEELDERFRRAVDAFAPEVVVVMTGRGESLDRRVGGSLMRSGSPELAAFLGGQLDRLRARLTDRGAGLVLLTVPCGASESMAANVAWVNGVWRTYADAHPDVVLADLAERDCPGGVHRSGSGDVASFWTWLAPAVRDAAPAA